MRNVFTVVLDGYMFTVKVEDDYHVKGSFDPDAACDLDYYGYRETELTYLTVHERFEVSGEIMWGAVLDGETQDSLINRYSNQIELEVQYLLDKQKGDL